MKFNPFRPNHMAGPGMFAGRVDEMRTIDQALFQTKNGNPRPFLIHGERGIGKSSLLLVSEMTASGELTGWESNATYKFVVVNVEIEEATTFDDLIVKVGADLAAKLRKIESLKNKASDFWGFITNWEVMGVRYKKNASRDSCEASIESLCQTITEACSRLTGSIDGLVIFVDEADNASADCKIGVFVKLITERLLKNGCSNVCLGLSGISHIIDKLRDSHESSSVRALNHILLEPLLPVERIEVINAGLSRANEKSDAQISIRPDAADWIAKFSEGFPHFIQQYAYSAFETDNDNIIDIEDVHHGAFKENGALDQLGVNYFDEMYRAQINSDEYRKVLHAMADSQEKFASRKAIKDATGLKDTTLGNALHALKARHIIITHPEKKRLYRLPSDSFGVWIRAQARREKEKPALKQF